MSQTDVTEELAISQATGSQLERPTDLKLSTLRRYLARLGAQLRLVAVSEEGDEERRIHFTVGDGQAAGITTSQRPSRPLRPAPP